MSTSPKLPIFDLTQSHTYREGTPNHVFAALRRYEPVYFHPRSGGQGFWCITKYADIATVGLDTKRFSSTRKTELHPSADLEAMAGQMVITTDPPRHTRLRKAIQYAFTPKRILAAESVIRHYIDEALNTIIENGEADLYAVAASLPISMISRLMGLPDEMHPQILEWTNKTFGVDEPEYAATPAESANAFREIFAYALKIASKRRANPGDDLVSALVAAEVDGEPLNDEEIAANFFVLLGAGNDTTRTLILNATNLLLDHPESFAELAADRTLIRNAIEEVLRLEPSVRGMGRLATEDTELRGQKIQEGDHVYMWYVSGNRDEDVFPEADTFDILRKNANRHQSFGGGGPHHCVGAPLARLQTQLMLGQIMNRMPDISRSKPATRAESRGFVNSLKSLPIRFSPGPVKPLTPILSGSE